MLTNLVSSPSTIVFVSVERAFRSRCSNRVAVVTTTVLPLTIDNSPVSSSNTTSYSPCLTSDPLTLVSVKKDTLTLLPLANAAALAKVTSKRAAMTRLTVVFISIAPSDYSHLQCLLGISECAELESTHQLLCLPGSIDRTFVAN